MNAHVRLPLAPILAVNFVGALGLSIVLPFLVYVVDAWGGNAMVYGVISASYSAWQLIGAPILGRWSDRQGRRKVLLISHSGTLLSWIVFLVAFYLPELSLFDVSGGPLGAFTVTLPLLVLLFARSLDGLTGGNISVANAYLADVSSVEDRNANYGKMALSANLGFVVGPALAGLLAGTLLGPRLPVIAAIGISVVALGVIYWRLPESRPPAPVGKTIAGDQEEKRADGKGLREIFHIPCIARLITTHFLVMLAFHFFYAAFPMYVSRNLEWTPRGLGVFFAGLSLMMVLVQGPILGRVSRSVREGPLVLFGLMVLAASFWLFGSGSIPLLALAAAGMALGNGLMWPSLLSLISKAAGSEDQGVVQGYTGSGGALASIFGLVMGGVLFENIGPWVFVVSAGIFVLAGVVALSLGQTLGRVRDREELRPLAE